jgi:hypothetical protein
MLFEQSQQAGSEDPAVSGLRKRKEGGRRSELRNSSLFIGCGVYSSLI